MHAVHEGRSCTRHPDTGGLLLAEKIPRWREILALALHAAKISELGYVGVDVVLADRLGPTVLELNARPGLDIQIANLVGLRGRLEGL